MTQTFDPFAEVPGPSPGAIGAQTGPQPGGGWTPPEEGLLEQIVRIVRRRKWVVLQALVIVTLLSFLYSKHETTQYTANANLLFGSPSQSILPSNNSAAVVDPTGVAATNSNLVTLPIIANYASTQTGGKISASEIHGSVTVTAGANNSSVSTIQAVSGSPARAAEIANAYGRGFVVFTTDYAQANYATSIRQITANLATLPAAQAAGPEGRTLRSELATLQNAQVLHQGDAQLVQPATPPTSPSSPNTKRNVILGVVIGLVLGLILAAMLERFDRRISDQDDFERIYGLPVLAEIPRTRELSRGDLTFEVGERFRALRTNLRYVNFDQGMRSLLVASPLPEDGKSTVAHSLAKTMAMMGDRVVLVELDMHKPSAHELDGRGLSSVLIGDELDDALISEELPATPGEDPRHLTVLPAGVTPPNPSELIDSDRMRVVLAQLERRFEIVVLDAPALSSVSDGLALIPAVSGVLVVAGLGHTTKKAATSLRQQIAMLRGHPVGLVVNFTRRQRHGKYYRYEH